MTPGILAAGRQPAELHGEDQHQQQRQHEARHGEAGDGRDHHRPIDRRAAMQRGVDAGRNADADLDQQRGKRQRQRRRNALGDQRDRRPAVAHRAAEFALGDRAEIVEILHPDRLIEAPGLAEGRDHLRRRFGSHDHQRRIAGQAQHDEGEGDDEHDRQQRAADPHGKEAQHQAALLPRLRRRHDRWQATLRVALGCETARLLDAASSAARWDSADERRSPTGGRRDWADRPAARCGRRCGAPARATPTPARACRDAAASANRSSADAGFDDPAEIHHGDAAG